MKKKLVIEFTFDEVVEDEDWTSLNLKKIALVKSKTTLTEDELSALGEEIAQTDRWQVDNWISLQSVMSGDGNVVIK